MCVCMLDKKLTFVAQKTSPTFFADTFVGLATGPMNATRITDTLIAEWAVPAVTAIAFVWPRTIALDLVTTRQTSWL